VHTVLGAKIMSSGWEVGGRCVFRKMQRSADAISRRIKYVRSDMVSALCGGKVSTVDLMPRFDNVCRNKKRRLRERKKRMANPGRSMNLVSCAYSVTLLRVMAREYTPALSNSGFLCTRRSVVSAPHQLATS
jgi:hypothetical protein